MNPSPTVFLVDDDVSVLESTARLFRAAGLRVETHSDPAIYLRGLNPDHPGVLVLDMRMPNLAGLEVFRRVRDRGARLPVLFLSGAAEIDQVVAAMKLGAEDFLIKPVPARTLVSRVQEALARDGEERRRASERVAIVATLESLHPREREVLDLVIRGKPSREIAVELGIVEKTVENHRAKLFRRFEAKNAVQLTMKVLLAGYRPGAET